MTPFLFIIVLGVTTAQRAEPLILTNIYVDGINGKNWRDGTTPETAFQTVGKACQTTGSHTAIWIMNGTYNNHNYGNGGGSNSAVGSVQDKSDILISAMEGHKPKIKFDGSGGISMR